VKNFKEINYENFFAIFFEILEKYLKQIENTKNSVEKILNENCAADFSVILAAEIRKSIFEFENFLVEKKSEFKFTKR